MNRNDDRPISLPGTTVWKMHAYFDTKQQKKLYSKNALNYRPPRRTIQFCPNEPWHWKIPETIGDGPSSVHFFYMLYLLPLYSRGGSAFQARLSFHSFSFHNHDDHYPFSLRPIVRTRRFETTFHWRLYIANSHYSMFCIFGDDVD